MGYKEFYKIYIDSELVTMTLIKSRIIVNFYDENAN